MPPAGTEERQVGQRAGSKGRALREGAWWGAEEADVMRSSNVQLHPAATPASSLWVANSHFAPYFPLHRIFFLTFYFVLSKSESPSAVSDSLRPRGLYSPWNSPGQNTGVGSLCLLQGIFPTQGSNPGLLHCRQILYQLSHKRSPFCIKV